MQLQHVCSTRQRDSTQQRFGEEGRFICLFLFVKNKSKFSKSEILIICF